MFTKHKPHAGRRKGLKCRFCPWWPWSLTFDLTLTFKLVQARDQARLSLPHSFQDVAHPGVLARPLESNGQLKSKCRLILVSHLLQITFEAINW